MQLSLGRLASCCGFKAATPNLQFQGNQNAVQGVQANPVQANKAMATDLVQFGGAEKTLNLVQLQALQQSMNAQKLNMLA